MIPNLKCFSNRNIESGILLQYCRTSYLYWSPLTACGLNRENDFFRVPARALRIWSRETGCSLFRLASARFFSTPRLKMFPNGNSILWTVDCVTTFFLLLRSFSVFKEKSERFVQLKATEKRYGSQRVTSWWHTATHQTKKDLKSQQNFRYRLHVQHNTTIESAEMSHTQWVWENRGSTHYSNYV